MEVNRPKRLKAKDNPYTLRYLIEENRYIVSFKDISGKINNIEVNKEVFEAFDEFELKDKSQMNEYDRHIEHSEVKELTIDTKRSYHNSSLEDDVISKDCQVQIIKEIWRLPKPQNRRVYMKIVNEFTYTEIAKIEHCSIPAVKKCIDSGIIKLQKKLKKF